ncbi:MAG TPA: DUF2637 domain-containing protein [Trebonia sp.]|nr:DUF2637 domain-containing protein [Trebonia sp.]
MQIARWATGLAVLAVATIAAIVSYTHIQTLALSHGYTPGTAGLLPFSVDGLIVASSLALANGARAWLARTGLVLGVLATVAANVAFGARFGLVGEIISAWPAGAFLVSSEILLSLLRARPVADEAGQAVVHEADEDQADDDIPARVLSMPTRDEAPKTPTGTRATRTAPKRKPSPERVFAADIEAGRVPSLRAVKEGCHVGTDKAREIREQLLALVGNEAVAA